MSILTLTAVAVNFDFATDSTEADEYRPSAGPDFVPSAEEQAEASKLLNEEPEPDWEALADEASAMDRVYLGCYAF